MKSIRSHFLTSHTIDSKLPTPLHHFSTWILTRAQDSQSEEISSSFQKFEGSQLSWGWLPTLTLTSTLGMLSVSHAYTSARNGAPWSEFFFWFGLLLIFVPSAARQLFPAVSKFERIGLICVVGTCLYIVAVTLSPLYLTAYDALLHLRTVNDITGSRHLFAVNDLLPVSSFYQGLEIVTNALSTMTELSTFHAGIILIGIARILMLLSLFLIYERILKSIRMAGIATTLYMTDTSFLSSNTQFAYESLALPMMCCTLFVLIYCENLIHNKHRTMLVAWIMLAAIVVTHHMTDIILVGLLLLWTIVYGFRYPTKVLQSPLAKTALFGVVSLIVWINLKHNPVIDYFYTYTSSALNDLRSILSGTDNPRQLFQSGNQLTPLLQRLTSTSATAFLLLSLPPGLFCLWQRYRSSVFLSTLGLFSLFYPIIQIFRFTANGYDFTDRGAAFLFIAIVCILTILVTQIWPLRLLTWRKITFITCIISILFLGGVKRPPWAFLPGPYSVTLDNRSIEPEGIQTALWSRSHLGSGNEVATNAINQLLMSSYGAQHPIIDTKVTLRFFALKLAYDDVAAIRDTGVRYLVVDLRLSKQPPKVDYYFEQGEPGYPQQTTPVNVQALTKFSIVPQIDRVFDSGDIVIYDVGGPTLAQKKS